MVPHEPLNTLRSSAGELYGMDMPVLVPVVSAYPAEANGKQDFFPFPIMAFDDDDEEDDDIDEEDNFDDMEDDFEDDFDDDFDNDDDADDYEDEDENYDDDYDEDYEEFDE